jgi:CheY-like chemotaxis protein
MNPMGTIPTLPMALIADDNPDNRNICRIVLENAGFQVTEALDGEQAIQTLEKQTFMLLLLDLQMPNVNGRSVLHWLRARTPADTRRRMQVVVITANPHWVTDEIDTLADYVMQKPIPIVPFSQFVTRIKADMLSLDKPAAPATEPSKTKPVSGPGQESVGVGGGGTM